MPEPSRLRVEGEGGRKGGRKGGREGERQREREALP